MSTPDPRSSPSAGVHEVDKLILAAIETGLRFPVDVKRWQLLAWAAEALEVKRQDPANFGRSGLRRVTAEHFPTVNPR